MLAGWLTNWWYDSFNPGLVITTAPTKRDVEDLLWKEVRLQRQRAGLDMDFVGPAAPEMRSAPDHYAKGYTARRGESFQGRHDRRMLFIFDEAIGVERTYWETTKTMFKPEHGHAWLCIFNPTDITSQAYQEEQLGGWKTFELSSLRHPNILNELDGKEPEVPAAVTLSQVREWVKDWCVKIRADERLATDFEFEGQLYRPGPEMESRCFGRWPSQGTYAVWSDNLWAAIADKVPGVPIHEPPQVGCDVARFGNDKTAIHARWGACSLLHEAAQGWSTAQTVGRLIEHARNLAMFVTDERRREGANRPAVEPEQVPLKIDDDGVGGGVTDRLVEQGYNAIAVRAGSTARDPARYPNKRSELWFSAAGMAQAGLIGLGRLDPQVRKSLKLQAMAPVWTLDSAGRRVVEPKEKTKDRLGRSPDDIDAMNLAYYEGGTEAPTPLVVPRAIWTPQEREESYRPTQPRFRQRRRLYGR